MWLAYDPALPFGRLIFARAVLIHSPLGWWWLLASVGPVVRVTPGRA